MPWSPLPSHLSPYLLETPWFRIHWYGFMYVVGYVTVYLLARWRMRRESFALTHDQLEGAMMWSLLGLAIGARLFYVIFYDAAYYLAHPIEVVWPFHDGVLVGFAGLSYHGALIGIIVTLLAWCRVRHVNPRVLADLLMPVVPLGYFFGRIGNFLNGELYGRPSDAPWAMVFPSDPLRLPRHPSQLYEAFLEGIVLFLILWALRKRFRGWNMLALYLIGYGCMRWISEVFRQPDAQIGELFLHITMGQLLSGVMVMAGLLMLFFLRKTKKVVSG
jgi:phosphatidylglycerol:prolipoprotein diacylglycerol transferase